MNLTKVVRTLTSYREFKDFKSKAYDLLHLHPNYLSAVEALTKEAGTKF